MKTIRTIITAVIAATAFAYSEGIPVDHATGKVLVSHTIITLSTEQIEETQALGTLTLTKEQERSLRAVSPQCPKRFNNVLPVTMRDCCCGIEGAYVIGLSRDKVAVLHEDYEHLDIAREMLFAEYSTHLHVNERGEFYHNGQLIPYASLLKALSAGPLEVKRNKAGKLVHTGAYYDPERESERFLYIELPVGAKPTDAVYHQRLTQIANTADQIGLCHGW